MMSLPLLEMRMSSRAVLRQAMLLLLISREFAIQNCRRTRNARPNDINLVSGRKDEPITAVKRESNNEFREEDSRPFS
jgi:hypothetical protein